MSKHTPGPWEVTRFGAIKSASPNTQVEYARGIGQPQIALVFVDDSRPEGERDANARVIAAAPDLLAALQALVAADGECWCSVNHDRDAGPLGPCELHGALEAARAAIAKAEGGGES